MSYLTMIPDVVWSAVVASALTFAGVMLSNRSNTNRLIRQLTHVSEEKEKDRISSLRKEVYLKAAEEMAKVNSYLGRIPDIDPTEQNVGEGLSGFFATAAKLQLVSQPETSRLAGELVTRYGEILMTLVGQAGPIHKLNTDIRIADDFYNRNQAEIARCLAEMTQLNESGQTDPVRFEALQRTFEASQESAAEYVRGRAQAYEKRSTTVKEYIGSLLKEIRSVGTLQVQLTAAIRGELNLETDIGEYHERLRSNFERMDKSLEKLVAKIEEG